MHLIQLKRSWPLFLAIALSCFITVSCQKELSGDSNIPGNPNDLSSKVVSSASGFVTDENNAPVIGASVKLGSGTTTTDKYGFFEIKNVEVVKTAAVVTVTRSNYFNGIKTYMAAEGKAAFFRIRLIPKTLAGTVSGSTGGVVTLTNGLKLSFPANAVMTETNGAVYTGTVHVAAAWLDPTAPDLNSIMPGDLRGLGENGDIKGLTTYGMAAVELTGDAGQKLQVAAGKKVTLNFPLPAAIAGSAPTTIPLWSFDESNGLWKQEGSAVKTGNEYIGDVSHFSYWNCDVPGPVVQVTVRFTDAAGNGIANAYVSFKPVGTTYGGAAHGYTDSSGYIIGPIPANATLELTVQSTNNCSTPVYTQTFTTTNANVNLGTIIINSISNLATLSGSVTNCSNAAVTNGYIILKVGYAYYRYPLSATGTYSVNQVLCTATQNVIIIAEDITAAQQSPELTQTIQPGNNAIPPIQACGISTQQYFNYTINGTSYSFTAPGDSLAFYRYDNGTNTPNLVLTASNLSSTLDASLLFTGAGAGAGSTQQLVLIQATQLSDSTTITTPINVNITEYGSSGQFAAGNFSGMVTGYPTPTAYTISGTFRVRKYF
jgi:hypothetical protein